MVCLPFVRLICVLQHYGVRNYGLLNLARTHSTTQIYMHIIYRMAIRTHKYHSLFQYEWRQFPPIFLFIFHLFPFFSFISNDLQCMMKKAKWHKWFHFFGWLANGIQTNGGYAKMCTNHMMMIWIEKQMSTEYKLTHTRWADIYILCKQEEKKIERKRVPWESCRLLLLKVIEILIVEMCRYGNQCYVKIRIHMFV